MHVDIRRTLAGALLAAGTVAVSLAACGDVPDAGVPNAGIPPEEAVVRRSYDDPLQAELARGLGGETSADERAAIAERLAADPAFDRSTLSERLHGLDLYPPLSKKAKKGSGYAKLDVEVGHGHRRKITLRVPRGYKPDRPWPLVYALHSGGGTGPGYMGRAESLLGDRVEEFLVAAPTHYRQTGIDAPPPFTVDHPAMLRALRQAVHVDADRVVVLGSSLGGYASWAVATLHADEVAGAVPIASAYGVPADFKGLAERLAPNFAHLPILHVWGGRDRLDVPGIPGGGKSSGSMSDVNRRFSDQLDALENVVNHQVPQGGHGGFNPPRKPFQEILDRRRVHYPKQVRHTFRHIHQARAYWLEGHAWVGDHWGEKNPRIKPRKGESWPDAVARVMMPLLGELRGDVDGQALRVSRQHVGDMTVWIGDGMVDWQQPVRLEVDGKEVFAGRLEPDLGVALAQAARTWDFDRLRWAGLRVSADGRVEKVTATTSFPPLIRNP